VTFGRTHRIVFPRCLERRSEWRRVRTRESKISLGGLAAGGTERTFNQSFLLILREAVCVLGLLSDCGGERGELNGELGGHVDFAPKFRGRLSAMMLLKGR